MDNGMGVVGIDPDDEQVLATELGGERLLWAGHPRRGLRLSAMDIFAIPFTFVWCAFAIFWERSVLASNASPFFVLWGAPFVAMGVYMVVGRFFVDAVRRRKTTYGLTSNRIIIVSGSMSRQVKSIELPSLGEISMSERGDGSGTIRLGPSTGLAGMRASMVGPSWPGAARFLPPMLEAIDGARAVFEKIRATKHQDPQVERSLMFR
jgi:hypothetical protein